jgi:hypothetical protein
MDRNAFENEIYKARELKKVGKKPEYWTGYMNGLRRRFFGEDFGTPQEHRIWLTGNGNKLNKLRAQGYRDGYGCTRDNGNCATCSLVENMQDCNHFRI